MAIDTKYGRVTLERGTIGEDEPVVVFRAQDAMLPALLGWYRARCATAGSPNRHLASIDADREAVDEWQEHHRTQIPQSAGSES